MLSFVSYMYTPKLWTKFISNREALVVITVWAVNCVVPLSSLMVFFQYIGWDLRFRKQVSKMKRWSLMEVVKTHNRCGKSRGLVHCPGFHLCIASPWPLRAGGPLKPSNPKLLSLAAQSNSNVYYAGSHPIPFNSKLLSLSPQCTTTQGTGAQCQWMPRPPSYKVA